MEILADMLTEELPDLFDWACAEMTDEEEEALDGVFARATECQRIGLPLYRTICLDSLFRLTSTQQVIHTSYMVSFLHRRSMVSPG